MCRAAWTSPRLQAQGARRKRETNEGSRQKAESSRQSEDRLRTGISGLRKKAKSVLSSSRCLLPSAFCLLFFAGANVRRLCAALQSALRSECEGAACGPARCED